MQFSKATRLERYLMQNKMFCSLLPRLASLLGQASAGMWKDKTNQVERLTVPRTSLLINCL